MSEARLPFVSALVGAALLAHAGAAAADGARWQRDILELTLDESMSELGPRAFAAVEAAAESWHDVDANTPALTLKPGRAGALGYVPGAANTSTVRFAPKGEPLAKGALGITVLTYDARRGVILDADIVINGVHRFADASESKGKSKNAYDLQSVLTHELGHLHGLGDDLEHPVAAMYAWSSPGEIQKRTLSGHDREALLALYADADDDAGRAASCASVPSGSGSGSWLALAGVLALVAACARERRAAVLAVGALLSLAGKADAVEQDGAAVATVSEVSATWHEGVIVSELQLSDVSCIGECGDATRVWMLGGRVGDIVQVVPHSPVPRVGTRVVIEVSRDGLRVAPVARTTQGVDR